jgi:transcription elongation factor GreA
LNRIDRSIVVEETQMPMKAIRSRLEEELRALEREFRIELPREIATAVAMGDLRENAEYKAALERQAYVRARIAQLRKRLGELSSINMGSIPRDRVALGSRVTLLNLDTDDEVTYELVFPEVSDLENGLISVASPMGRGLIGSTEGDEVSIQIPAGVKRFEVLELTTIHDRQTGN